MKWQQITLLMMTWYIYSLAIAHTTIPKPQVPFDDDIAGETLALDADVVPQAHFQISLDEGVIPLTVTFDASLSTNGERYEWYFGDGTTGEGIHVEHTYTTAGRHPVILRVILDDEEDYVYTYIKARPDPQFTAPLPAIDDSDPTGNYFRRNTQHVINAAYYENLQKLLEYTPANEIKGIYSHSFPNRNGVVYATHTYHLGKVGRYVPTGFTAINLATGEKHSFSDRKIVSRTSIAVTSDAKYFLMGVRGGDVYRVDTHTGEFQLIFELDTENAVAYDVLALSISPDDSELMFLLANTGLEDLGSGMGESRGNFPEWNKDNYVVSIPIDVGYSTLSTRSVVINKGEKFFVSNFVWFGDKVYELTKDRRLPDVSKENTQTK